MREPHARPLKPIDPPEPETLAELLLGVASIVLIFVLLFVILPVLA